MGWIAIEEFAKKYNLKARTVRVQVKSRKLKGVLYRKFGGLWRIWDGDKEQAHDQ